MTLRYGSLFSGYGGLEMGVQSVLGGTTAWFCEFDKAPSKILAHHWPDVPNLGDITTVDWATVEAVDVLTGGFPCQDVSHAGRRAGLIRDGEGRTRSGLWGHMLRAIDQLRPRLVVAENVRGLLSAKADSDVEPCPWCMGDANGEPHLRALGAVLADLADVGYDAWWYGLRAADVGAAHGRFRVFIFATPSDTQGATWGGPEQQNLRPAPGPAAEPREPAGAASSLTLLPTPMTVNRTSDKAQTGRPTSGPTRGGPSYGLEDVVTLLPTPAVNDMGASYTPEEWDAWTAAMQAKHGNGNGHGKSLSIEAQRLLPTPQAHDAQKGKTAEQVAAMRARGHGVANLNETVENLLPTPVADNSRGLTSDSTDFQSLPNEVAYRWGDYAPAIARWEAVLGRPAPAPTEPDKNGNPRLSPAFVEWLMGLPVGHVTDPAIGLTRNEQLKALGNGVVPQQAAAATRWWLDQIRQEAVA